MYPKTLTDPIEKELTSIGFHALKKPHETEKFLAPGTHLVVVNSVCGCAARSARPGIHKALQRTKKKPGQCLTIFAGVDHEVVTEARKHMAPYPASSPCIALFKDRQLVHFISRQQIEGKSDEMLAEHCVAVFEELC